MKERSEEVTPEMTQQEHGLMNDSYKELSNAVIMMVDDEPTTLEVVQAYLEEVGFHNFVQVVNSSQAMRVIEEARPDILLLDLVMPEVSGFDILSAVRNHQKFKHLPVIILTSSSDAKIRLRALGLSATDFLTKPVDQSELFLRVRNNLAAKAYLDQLAYYDPLTNLPNRQLFLEYLNREIADAKRLNNFLAVLNIEVDNFDRISDTIGLSAGDEVLREVARRIGKIVRDSDMLGRFETNEKAVMTLFRLDGAVFSLLLVRIRNVENPAIIAARVIHKIKEPMHVEGRDIYVTTSIGIATYPAESKDTAELLRLASSAKDYVKNKGGDSLEFSSSRINAMYQKRLSLETGLRKALERNEFTLYYQPKVDVVTGAIRGVEALLRWNNGPNSMLLPSEFISLAEETGMIVPIGEWVFREACRQLAEWHRAEAPPISMSLNVSARQLKSKEFFSITRQLIDESGLDTQYLTLEITESLLLDNIEDKITLMHAMKDLGLKLSIDDFGTGYSSFNYLRRLPADEVKIDFSFIEELAKHPSNRAIVSSIIFLAHNLGLKTVAEGVETKEQLEFLQKESCDMYQGSLFSRPVPSTELLKLLARDK